MKRVDITLWLLVVGCFLAPILGGQVNLGLSPSAGFADDIISPTLARTAHAIIALPFLIALLIQAVRGKILSVPSPFIFAATGCFALFLILSVAISDYRFMSLVMATEWLSMILAFFAVVACAGRGIGPKLLVGALLAGCTFEAARGILEYAVLRVMDPTWRIFGDWNNPNSLAGMLIMGLFLQFALTSVTEGVARLAISATGIMLGLALALTQSKGGLLAFGVGVLVFEICLFFLVNAPWKRKVVHWVPLIMLIPLVIGVQNAAKRPAALNRVTQMSSDQEQSAGFRQLLYRGALETIKVTPQGLGIGTYRYESSRSGVNPQTVFTHNSFLQLAFELGWGGLAAFLCVCFGWLTTVLRGIRKLAPERAMLLVGVIGSALASACHNMFDSGWYQFGTGMTLFVLFGIGLQLAADGSNPEFLPKVFRQWALVGSSTLVLGLLLLSATYETSLSHGVTTLPPLDPDALKLKAPTLETLRQLATEQPTSSNFRRLAKEYLAQGDPANAKLALKGAFFRDPNNLPAHLLLFQIELKEGDDNVERTLERMIEIKSKPYATIRAIPEIVMTEVAKAETEIALTDHFPPEQRLRLLKDAVPVFKHYAEVTVPFFKQFSAAREAAQKTDPEVRSTLELGVKGAEMLQALAGDQGDAEGKALATAALDAFRKASGE